MALHSAENRGYRELFAYSRQLRVHWQSLAERLGDGPGVDVLRRGAADAKTLIDELRPLCAVEDLHGGPAAQGAGASIARARGGVRDRFLERNQALRFAVEDVQHVTTLLIYLAPVSETSGNPGLAAAAGRWERKLRRLENDLRRAVGELGGDPDRAVEPLDKGPAGRAAHKLGFVMGSLGEWSDRRAAQRSGGPPTP